MFEPARMQKVKVAVMRRHLNAVLTALHSEGVINLTECAPSCLTRNKKGEVYEAVSRELVRLRAVKNALSDRGPVNPVRELPLPELLAECAALKTDEELAELESRRDAIAARLGELETLGKNLKRLADFGVSGDVLESGSYAVFLGTMPAKKIEGLRKSLASASHKHILSVKKASKTESACIIACDAKAAAKVEYELGKAGFARAVLEKGVGDPVKRLAEVEAEIQALKAETDGLEARRVRLSERYWETVVCQAEMLEAAHLREDAKGNMCGTETVAVFEGWVIKADLKRLEVAIAEATGGSGLVIPYESAENPPTVLMNHPLLKPFESMVGFISTPSYREKDPTVIFAFSFLLMYGFMMGDVGYGLVSLVMALALSRRASGLLKDLTRVWAYASVPTIVFGLFFDEYFGLSHKELTGYSIYTPWLHRMEDVNTLLLLSIAFGCAHLLVGYLIGFVNSVRHDRRHAAAKLLWMMLILSAIAAAYSSSSGDAGGIMLPAAAAAVASAAGIVRLEGLLGLFEMPGVAGNILSYARLMAVGMSSVVVAYIINDALKPEPGAGMLLTLPVFLLLHIINTGVGMFESSIQSARLNYTEFFGKFFEGGGRRFTPFLFRRVNTYR